MIDYAIPFADARWFDVVPRAAACPDVPARVLLHAGPPFRGVPPEPVINAAIQAMLFEGWAPNSGAARELLVQGKIELRPAQDHGVATPLAQVVSASMLLMAVRQQNQVCYAPMLEGSSPALRFGSTAPECLSRMRDVGAWVSAVVAPLVRRRPITIDAVVRSALAAGEECHARTAAANEAMVSSVPGLDPASATTLRAMPAFVLTILMAACATALRNHSGEISAIGGNGVDFGVRRRQVWHQAAAEAPHGVRFDGMDTTTPLAAIGDSAVIDYCGLGGQALTAEALARRRVLIDPLTGIVDAKRVIKSGVAPLIHLAILDRDGTAGLIGRGAYTPPVSLFHE